MEHLIDESYYQQALSNTGETYSEPDIVFMFRICFAACGIIFNLLLLFLFLRRRMSGVQQKSVYCFLESLIFANLVSSVGIIPYPKLSDIPDDGMGSLYCLFVFYPMLFWIGNIAGVFSLTCITLDRYVYVVHPKRHLRYFTKSNRLSRFVILCIWIVAILMNLAAVIVVSADDDNCTVEWVTTNNFKVFSAFIFLTLYVIPTIFHAVCYYRIRNKTKKSDAYALDTILSGNYPELTMLSRSSDITSFFILSLLFVLCWGQDQLFFLLLNLNVISTSLVLSSYRHVTTIFAYSLAAINPIVILLSNRQMKRAALESGNGLM
ncbi:galanin receptor type 1-like [Anneissia japonica]|uniref:galanin receptor type 1-like n=1 Tax=Anneissia japonica TaxID=1529436 RepID=UPI00142567E8|nr:galanin receptor type 1-like [Anneissia japonica]